MPQKRAAKKALRQSKKRYDKNLSLKSAIKDKIKLFKKAIDKAELTACQTALTDVYKILDKAASKKLIHPNKAARKKSRLTLALNKVKSKTA